VPSHGLQGEESMKDIKDIKDIKDNLTIKEVAKLLRCSKAHVQNALRGRVPGMPALTHLPMGRRKIVRRQWLEKWMESNKAS
jgi:excisionase family DNA binding protein